MANAVLYDQRNITKYTKHLWIL